MAASPRIEELRKRYDENQRRFFAPLANEYRKSGELEQAIALCRMHLAEAPNNLSGQIVFGQALYDAGSHDEARAAFEAAIGLDPENLIALRHLGDIARLQQDVPRAREWYGRVLDADRRNEDVLAIMDELNAAGSEEIFAAAAPASERAPENHFADVLASVPDAVLETQPTSETPPPAADQSEVATLVGFEATAADAPVAPAFESLLESAVANQAEEHLMDLSSMSIEQPLHESPAAETAAPWAAEHRETDHGALDTPMDMADDTLEVPAIDLAFPHDTIETPVAEPMSFGDVALDDVPHEAPNEAPASRTSSLSGLTFDLDADEDADGVTAGELHELPTAVPDFDFASASGEALAVEVPKAETPSAEAESAFGIEIDLGMADDEVQSAPVVDTPTGSVPALNLTPFSGGPVIRRNSTPVGPIFGTPTVPIAAIPEPEDDVDFQPLELDEVATETPTPTSSPVIVTPTPPAGNAVIEETPSPEESFADASLVEPPLDLSRTLDVEDAGFAPRVTPSHDEGVIDLNDDLTAEMADAPAIKRAPATATPPHSDIGITQTVDLVPELTPPSVPARDPDPLVMAHIAEMMTPAGGVAPIIEAPATPATSLTPTIESIAIPSLTPTIESNTIPSMSLTPTIEAPAITGPVSAIEAPQLADTPPSGIARLTPAAVDEQEQAFFNDEPLEPAFSDPAAAPEDVLEHRDEPEPAFNAPAATYETAYEALPQPVAEWAHPTPVVPAAGIEAFATETMAELYVRQGLRREAIAVYEQLVEARPHDTALQQRLAELQDERFAGTASTARSFFGGLASRTASRRSSRTPLGNPDMAQETPRMNDALGGLFGNSSVGRSDAAAASSLASAFGTPVDPSIVQSGEFSIDEVFKHPPKPASPLNRPKP